MPQRTATRAFTANMKHKSMRSVVTSIACACVLVGSTMLVASTARGASRHRGATKLDPDATQGAASRHLLSTPGVVLNAILQPTTFLRIALLMLRNSVLDNPAEEFLQMALTTDLGATKFTNVFASFAAGMIQDFSAGVSSEVNLNQIWLVDGSSTLENSAFSEWVSGGAVGIEQFYGVGLEISAGAAMAIQQSLQPKDDAEYEYAYEADSINGAANKRRRRLLSTDEAKARKLPVGAEVIMQTQHPLHGDMFRRAATRALNRTKMDDADENEAEQAFRRRLLQDEIVDVTYDDVERMTTNWFESFPAALPLAIRDRFIALLEEYIVDPQIRISLDITVALVGVATPGVGITSVEAAAENTISNQIVFHGYDAGIDFASSIDPAVALAGSVSKGVAIEKAIADATEVLTAVTAIIDEVNGIVEDDLAARESDVSAQGGVDHNMTLLEKIARYVRPLGNRTVTGPTGVDTSRAVYFAGQNENASETTTRAEDDYVYTPYDYEPLGAVEGVYAVAVSLIFLEQVALNGGSITVI